MENMKRKTKVFAILLVMILLFASITQNFAFATTRKDDDNNQTIDENLIQEVKSTSVTSANIEEGVYALKNVATGYYMEVGVDFENKYETFNRPIQQYYYGPSNIPSTENHRWALLKIERLPSGNYVVRTMHNNRGGITEISNTIRTMGVTPNNNDVGTAFEWAITYEGNGSYCFRSFKNTDNVISAQDSVEGTQLVLRSLGSAANYGKWQLIKYQGPPFKSYISEPKYTGSHIMNMGTTKNVSVDNCQDYYFYSTTVGENASGSTIGYMVSNPSGVSTTAATITNTGLLTANYNKVGMVSVRAINENGNVSEPYNIFIKPTSGTFCFLQNIQLSGGIQQGYIQPKNNGAAKAELTYDTNQIWEIINIDWPGNPVLIRNVETGTYLTSPASTVVNDAILTSNFNLSSASGGDNTINSLPHPRQMWFITNDTITGAAKIQSLYHRTYAPNLYLNVRSSTDTTLVQRGWVNNSSYLDEFNVITLDNDVVILGADTKDVPSSPDLTGLNIANNMYKFNNKMLNPIYNSFGVYPFVNTNASTIRDLMLTSKIYMHMGHATSTSTVMGRRNGSFRVSDMDNLDLSNLKLAIFFGCETAKPVSNGMNLPQKATSQGSSAALGFKIPIEDKLRYTNPGTSAYSYVFFDKVFQGLTEGRTLNQSCALACLEEGIPGKGYDSYKVYYRAGISSFYLKD